MSTRAVTTFAISLFGTPLVRYGGTALSSQLAKTTVTVLAYLLVNRHLPLRREDVAFALWPDETESGALANLRRQLHLLSRALPVVEEPWILTEKRFIRWNSNLSIELDVDNFERYAGIPRMRANAIELYAGDFLAGYEAPWIQERRESFAEMFASAALALASEELARGDHATASALAARVLTRDPWREDAVRVAIACRVHANDRAGALAIYREFARLIKDELDAEPMEQTRTLADAILTDRTGNVAKQTIPVRLSTFIGRETEVVAVARALELRRLVTLVGAGGVGKSRLALAVVEALRSHFSDDIAFVEFAATANDRLSFERTLLETFGIVPSDERVVEVLARVFGSRRTLLVLDNLEHLVDNVDPMLVELFARLPDVTVLATSRQPLRFVGEQVVSVRPLATVDENASPEAMLASEAVRLFIDRARAQNADVIFSARDVRHIGAIARRLDGIPLAIELAAARSTVLSPRELDRHLTDRFGLLKTRAVTAVPHHQTLRNTLDWSFNLLDRSHRTAFARLGVFTHGWTLDAAAAVFGDDAAEDGADTLDIMATLIDQSLVSVADLGDARRYFFLETIKAYARLRLAELDDGPETYRRAGSYYLSYVDRRRAGRGTFAERDAFDEFATEHENLLAVIDEALGRDDVAIAAQMTASLSPFWIARGFVVEAQRRIEALLDRDARVAPPLRGRLLDYASIVHYRRGEVERSMERTRACMRLARHVGDAILEADGLIGEARCAFASGDTECATNSLNAAHAIATEHASPSRIAKIVDFKASIALACGQTDAADDLRRESLAFYEDVGDLDGVATVTYHLGFQAYEKSDFESSIACSEKAMAIWRDFGDIQRELWAHYNLACARAALGQVDRAARAHLDCIERAHRNGFVWDLSNALERIAGLLIEPDASVAARCMAYAEVLRTRHGHAIYGNERAKYERDLGRVRDVLGQGPFRLAWEEGTSAAEDALVEIVRSAVRTRYFT